MDENVENVKKELITELQNMPVVLDKKERELYGIKKQMVEIDSCLDVISKRHNRMITDEKDDNGKALYSNALKRSIEQDRRLAKDKDYQAYAKMYNRLKEDSDELEMAITFIRRRFSANKCIARLMTQ